MLPLLLAGGIWAYNAVKIAQLSNRNNRLKKRDPDDENAEKNLTIFHNCNFKHEDKRIYNNYNNCTFNYYIIKKGKDDE